MNGANDYFAFIGQLSYRAHNHLSHVGIEATRWLVAEQDLRIG